MAEWQYGSMSVLQGGSWPQLREVPVTRHGPNCLPGIYHTFAQYFSQPPGTAIAAETEKSGDQVTVDRCCFRGWAIPVSMRGSSWQNFSKANSIIVFLGPLLTQAATWQPNHNILTSSGNAILKATYNTFFGTKFGGRQTFIFTLGGFYNKREYSSNNWLDPCRCLSLRINKSMLRFNVIVFRAEKSCNHHKLTFIKLFES